MQAVGLVVADELALHGIETELAAQEDGDVGGVASDVRVAGHLGIGPRLASRLDAIEEIADVEGGWIAADFRHFAAGQEGRRTEASLPESAVSTQPVVPSKRTGQEPSGSQPLSRKTSLMPLA